MSKDRTHSDLNFAAMPGSSREGDPSLLQRVPAWRRWLPLLAIWLAAFALRLFLSQTDRVVWGDEPFYLWLGRNWVTGQGYGFMGHPDVHHGPFFPWLAGIVYLLTGDLELASEILYVLFGSLLVLPVYALGRELYGRRVGLGAAALAAVFPALTVATLHWGTMTEPVYMFSLYLGLWAGCVALRPIWGAMGRSSDALSLGDPWWAYALAGLSFGAAYLTRPEAIAYVVIVGAYILLLRAAQRGLGNVRFWGKLALYGLAFAVAFLPYAYYVRQHTGAWMVSEKVGVAYLTGIGLAHGDTGAFDRATWGLDSTGLETFFFSSESYTISMFSLIVGDPKTFLGIVYLNTQRFVRVFIDWTMFPYLLLPVAVLGLFDRGWARKRTLQELYLLLSSLPVLSFILFFIQARYLVAFVPVLILWTARGLLRFSDWLTGTLMALRTEAQAEGGAARPFRPLSQIGRSAIELVPVVLTMALLLAAHPHVQEQVTGVGSFRMAHRTVGEYLGGALPSGAVLMSRYPAIAFHADLEWVPTPNASLPELLRYARHKGVGYFAIDERELAYRPQFQGLVTGGEVPSELRLVHTDVSEGERLVVYELLEP